MAYEVRKVVCKADDYPGQYQMMHCQPGDKLFLLARPGAPIYNVGDVYQEWGNPWRVHRVYYARRPWWRFWEPKRVQGYQVMYVDEVSSND